ncbi:retinoic acid-induced protein 2 [Stigmatopora argus]
MEASSESSRSDATQNPEREERGGGVVPSGATGLNKGSPAEKPGSATDGGALKMSAAVLHPVCLGDNPLMVPIHLQMAAGAGAQLSPIGAAPYLLTGPNQVSLPLVLDPSVIPQNNLLCSNSLSFVEQKSAGAGLGPPSDANLLSLLQNPAFAAILQDLFPPQGAPPPCQSPGSPFFPYSSPLAPLVPPATLLVPYPVVIPLPVPMPIPLPVPVPQTEDSKSELSKTVCAQSKSTQTPREPDSAPQSASPQILDLSMRRPCGVEPKQEYPAPPLQDSVLDLSVPAFRKRGGPSSLGPTRSLERSASLDSKIPGGLASADFSRQRKWTADGNGGVGASAAPNPEAVGPSPTSKVIVSVKDAIPAILCGKIKGLSGVSTKNFSIKRDGSQGAAPRLFGAAPPPSPSRHDPDAASKKVPGGKTGAIKLKKVGSQEIHFLPIKKQRLAALFPRK